MPRLVDTTIRLLSQDPLAGQVSTGRLLELAALLDRAGFEYLEVTGGGVFDSMVRRGVESPWERIRSLKLRCQTPLAMAVRGRFLVGSKPFSRDLVRRFVASAAESGIDVFRIHDPLNDISNLTDAAAAVGAAGKELVVGLVHNPGPDDEIGELVARAKELPELGASRVVVNDPAGSLGAVHAREIVERVAEASGLPVGLYCQGAAGRALAAAIEAARGGATPIASTIYPVALTLYRPSAEALSQSLHGLGIETGIAIDLLWEACELVDEAMGDEPVRPLPPRVAVRAAEYDLPAGVVAGIDSTLRGQGFPDRLDEVLAELRRLRGGVRLPAAGLPDRERARLAGAPQRAVGAALRGRRRRAPRPDRRSVRRDSPPRRCGGGPCSGAARQRRGLRGVVEREPRRNPRRRRRARRERGGAAAPRPVRRAGEAAAPVGEGTSARRGVARDERARVRTHRADPRPDRRRAGDGDRRGDDRGGRDADHDPPVGRARGRRRSGAARVGPARRGSRRRAGPASAAARRRADRVADGRARSTGHPSPGLRRSWRSATPSRPARRCASSRR